MNVLDKSKNFKFTIGNYNENLDLIKKEEKSYFPLLEKKRYKNKIDKLIII